MPRHAKAAERGLPPQSLVIDNGAYSIKAGFAADDPQLSDCKVIPNCIAKDRGKRVWVGSQLDKCVDFGEIVFRRPVEKGFVVNWEAEKAVWDNIFIDSGAILKCDPSETNLILGEAPNTPVALQTNCDQVVFEEYEFASYSRCLSSSLNSYLDVQNVFGDPPRESSNHIQPTECLLVVDSGFSHTTVTPLYQGKPIQQAIRRLDIGGKFLTNYLKELVSIRHYNMLDETYLMNEVKEAVCFVTDDFRRDLDLTYNGTSKKRKEALGGDRDILIDYVLPDYNAHKQGFTRPHDSSSSAKMRKIGALTGAADITEDFMTLGNERFTVPELLFNPRDIGMKQPGIPDLILSSLTGVPTALWPAMLANVLVSGGNCLMSGFMDRLEIELRQLTPAECRLRVARSTDPIKSSWLGGCHLANDPALMKRKQITKQEYQENGSQWLTRVFSGMASR